MKRYRVVHETEYTYASPVSVGHSQVFLQPRDLPHQRCLTSQITVNPEPAQQNYRRDYFGNQTLLYAVQEPHEQMLVRAVSEVEVRDRPTEPSGQNWEEVRDQVGLRHAAEDLATLQHCFPSAHAKPMSALTAYAAESFPPGRPIVEAGLELTRRIFRDFEYDPSTTTITTPVTEVFDQRSGVCQDFAHLQIAMLRGLGLPARYVSGYLRTFRGDDSPDQKLVGDDASHAWLSLYVGHGRWVDFDPTNDQIPGPHHITVAWGRDYADVSPVKGVILGGDSQTIDVRVRVDELEPSNINV